MHLQSQVVTATANIVPPIVVCGFQELSDRFGSFS
jgi:hypothetical protein